MKRLCVLLSHSGGAHAGYQVELSLGMQMQNTPATTTAPANEFLEVLERPISVLTKKMCLRYMPEKEGG